MAGVLDGRSDRKREKETAGNCLLKIRRQGDYYQVQYKKNRKKAGLALAPVPAKAAKAWQFSQFASRSHHSSFIAINDIYLGLPFSFQLGNVVGLGNSVGLSVTCWPQCDDFIMA